MSVAPDHRFSLPSGHHQQHSWYIVDVCFLCSPSPGSYPFFHLLLPDPQRPGYLQVALPAHLSSDGSSLGNLPRYSPLGALLFSSFNHNLELDNTANSLPSKVCCLRSETFSFLYSQNSLRYAEKTSELGVTLGTGKIVGTGSFVLVLVLPQTDYVSINEVFIVPVF